MNPITKIRELYKQNPKAKIDWGQIESDLNQLEQKPPPNFSIGTLDKYPENVKLSNVLAYLPPETIHSELGDDALIWTWVKYKGSTQIGIIGKGIKRITGRNLERLEKARRTAWKSLNSSEAGLVKSIYDLNEKVLGGITDSINLHDLLQRNAENGIDLSEKRLNHYSLMPLTTEGTNIKGKGNEITWEPEYDENSNIRYSIWLDTPTGISLAYKGKPQAVVGFIPNDNNILMIYQIQGIRPKIIENKKIVRRGSSRGLIPIDWQKLLVEVIECIGQQTNYKQIGIQSGYNNEWVNPDDDGEIHIQLEEALKRYDDVAQRLNFRQEDSKNWYKKL